MVRLLTNEIKIKLLFMKNTALTEEIQIYFGVNEN